MTIEEALKSRLTSYAGLAALIGSRAFPMALPENPTLPAVVYQRISGTREQALGGSTGLARPRFQVIVWATTYAQARAAATQVRLALDGWDGVLGGTGGVQASITLLNEIDAVQTDPEQYGAILDFGVWHRE